MDVLCEGWNDSIDAVKIDTGNGGSVSVSCDVLNDHHSTKYSIEINGIEGQTCTNCFIFLISTMRNVETVMKSVTDIITNKTKPGDKVGLIVRTCKGYSFFQLSTIHGGEYIKFLTENRHMFDKKFVPVINPEPDKYMFEESLAMISKDVLQQRGCDITLFYHVTMITDSIDIEPPVHEGNILSNDERFPVLNNTRDRIDSFKYISKKARDYITTSYWSKHKVVCGFRFGIVNLVSCNQDDVWSEYIDKNIVRYTHVSDISNIGDSIVRIAGGCRLFEKLLDKLDVKVHIPIVDETSCTIKVLHSPCETNTLTQKRSNILRFSIGPIYKGDSKHIIISVQYRPNVSTVLEFSYNRQSNCNHKTITTMEVCRKNNNRKRWKTSVELDRRLSSIRSHLSFLRNLALPNNSLGKVVTTIVGESESWHVHNIKHMTKIKFLLDCLTSIDDETDDTLETLYTVVSV